MRQSQMERRIAVQLMHTRHEKEAIKRNRMELEKQFTERRLQDFQQALDREAVSFCLCVCVFFVPRFYDFLNSWERDRTWEEICTSNLERGAYNTERL